MVQMHVTGNLLESSDIDDIRYGFHEEQAYLLQNVETYAEWCKAERVKLIGDRSAPGVNKESKVNNLSPVYGAGRK